jgi:hypothetical protein
MKRLRLELRLEHLLVCFLIQPHETWMNHESTLLIKTGYQLYTYTFLVSNWGFVWINNLFTAYNINIYHRFIISVFV